MPFSGIRLCILESVIIRSGSSVKYLTICFLVFYKFLFNLQILQCMYVKLFFSNSYLQFIGCKLSTVVRMTFWREHRSIVHAIAYRRPARSTYYSRTRTRRPRSRDLVAQGLVSRELVAPCSQWSWSLDVNDVVLGLTILRTLYKKSLEIVVVQY